MTTSLSDCIQVNVRCLLRNDLESVVAIDHASLIPQWKAEDFVNFVKETESNTCLIAEILDGREFAIVGYAAYVKDKKSLLITRLAVRPDFRKSETMSLGAGRALVEQIKRRVAKGKHFKTVSAIVPETARAAIEFFRCCDFHCCKVIRNHFGEKGDGYLFSWPRGR